MVWTFKNQQLVVQISIKEVLPLPPQWIGHLMEFNYGSAVSLPTATWRFRGPVRNEPVDWHIWLESRNGGNFQLMTIPRWTAWRQGMICRSLMHSSVMIASSSRILMAIRQCQRERSPMPVKKWLKGPARLSGQQSQRPQLWHKYTWLA